MYKKFHIIHFQNFNSNKIQSHSDVTLNLPPAFIACFLIKTNKKTA